MRKMTMRVLGLAVCLFFVLAPLAFAQVDYCEGNFDYDQDQDGGDAFTFKTDFGRSQFFSPCPPDGPAPVPKTGLTASYATSDDGDLEKGVPWPNPRFTDNGDGTVTDNLTGLIWLKDANCFYNRTWYQAIDDCKGLANGSCGLTDGSVVGNWRLPNIKELLSLVHYGYSNPPIPNTAGTGKWTEGNPFNNVQSNIYWSSTSCPDSPDLFAFELDVTDCDVNGIEKENSGPLVWPVRGGQ